jgi:hypothetical protein
MAGMTHNYQGMKDKTIRPAGKSKTVARSKRWDWRKTASAPSAVRNIPVASYQPAA